MRVLVYEWCCSGGLSGPDTAVVAPASASVAELESLTPEGRAMFLAVLQDGCRAADLELHALVDEARALALPAGVQLHPVAAGTERAALVATARDCDAVLVIAPETGGILADRVAAARATGTDVIAPGPRFIALAADKQATILALAAAGLPVPAGRTLAAGEQWPSAFRRPAVAKRLDGVGCDGLIWIGVDDPWPPPAGVPLRIEAAADGLPVGVACLTGGGRITPLPPMRQQFSPDHPRSYIGGEPIEHEHLARRAVQLATRSVAALERAAGDHARGWVGVDMILGPREDGRSDRVLEVNPRLTTSFLGHVAASDASLLARIISPQTNPPRANPRPCQFTLPDYDVA